MSLPIKYRPQKFEELRGQDTIQKVLGGLISKGQIARNIILHGHWGCAKTTSARLYAKALNCIHPTQEGSPCGKCESCGDFAAGDYFDYKEIDGARSGRIDNIKELIEISNTPPMLGKYRVITIDEAQGLSDKAWDSLLKTIEEPPPFLVYIFTTTEISKIRKAIISRCLSLEVQLLNKKTAIQYLEDVCRAEGIEYDMESLNLIEHISKGHPRDLLKNLEQVTFIGNATIENTRTCFEDFGLNTSVGIVELLLEDLTKTLIKNKAWNLSPNQKLQRIKEVFLHLFYTRFQNTNIQTSPYISSVSDIVWDNLHKRIKVKVAQSRGDITIAISNLIEILTKLEAKSEIEFELSLIYLYNMLNTHNFNMSGVKNIQSTSNNASKRIGAKPKGRQFLTNYSVKEQEPVYEMVKEIDLTEELMLHGFKKIGV